MMRIRRFIGHLIIGGAAVLASSAFAQEPSPNDPFAQLRAAYAERDAAAAARAYAPDARYIEVYDGERAAVIAGREAIERHFRAIFEHMLASSPPSQRIDLNFRALSANRGRISGLYRIRFGDGLTAGPLFGRFSTRAGVDGFTMDLSGPADHGMFEDAAGPLMFAADEETLDPVYYGALTGSWLRPDGCRWTVTRSTRRLFLLDECSGAWRGLNRVSGRDWRAGNRIIDDGADRPVRFLADGRLSVDNRVAVLDATVRQQGVAFPGPVGVLNGTLYRPANAATADRPAIVLVHGSGPQDRDGYASIIQLMALQLSRAGLVVLTYDKRGVGRSEGDWATAGFADLAADANAAMAFLRLQDGVDETRVGLGGSSQAGWIAAQSVADGGAPAFVMLIGAAGSALTVEEQNIYNTGVLMRCAGISARDTQLVLAQQRAFFAARRDRALQPELARATAAVAARADAALNDWLFPADVTPTEPSQWYDVLNTQFDPMAVWRSYRGPMLLLFGEHDDSTPTSVARQRLQTIMRPGMTVATIAGAQHIGLATDDVCRGDLATLSTYAPGFWNAVDSWARGIASRR